jgi:hypothetical protein
MLCSEEAGYFINKGKLHNQVSRAESRRSAYVVMYLPDLADQIHQVDEEGAIS